MVVFLKTLNVMIIKSPISHYCKTILFFRADTDILLGKNCGLKTLMVGTGVGTLQEVRNWETDSSDKTQALVPNFFADKLKDLLPHIKRNI